MRAKKDYARRRLKHLQFIDEVWRLHLLQIHVHTQ